MTGLISLLIGLLILALVIGIFWWGMNQIALPQPIRMIIMVLIAIVVLLWLLNGGIGHLNFR